MDKQALEYKPYLIKCKGLIGLSERQQLEALEVRLCEYYPGSAFLARLLDARLEAVKKLSFVAEASLFEPEQKFAGGLMKALALTPDGPGEKKKVIVKLFENADAHGVVEFIRLHDGRVSGHDSQWLEVELLPEQLVQMARLHEVQYIEEKGEYELLNNRAGEIIRAPSLWNKGLSGAGLIIGIADTGLDTGVRETLHPDLKSKLVALYALGRKGDASDPNGHGTHVAGSAYGKGDASQGRYRGVAPAASLVFQSVMDKDGKLSGLPGDLGVLIKQAYDAGARVYNISWGMTANGAYNYASAQLDRFVWEHDDMAVAVAAGNSGQARSITSPGTAKNVITVGACENNRPDKGVTADNPAELAFFSSRGPAGDGRCKPDVVAPGTWILSTRSSLAQDGNYWGVKDQYYAYSSGTSMATPIVTGMLALVREYFIQVRSWQPSAALLKAALLDGAFALPGYMENDGGWGRLNAPAPAFSPTRKCLFADQETKLATGESKTYEYQLSAGGGPIKITLVWTDYPAQANAAAALVNDLDLTVQSPSGQTFSPGDHVNNIEQVVIPDPQAGVYKVTVSGCHVPMGYQQYALFVSGGQLAQIGGAAPVVNVANSTSGGSGEESGETGTAGDVTVRLVELNQDGILNCTNSTSVPSIGGSAASVWAGVIHEGRLDVKSHCLMFDTGAMKDFDAAGQTGEHTINIQGLQVIISWPLEGVIIKGRTEFKASIRSDRPLGKISFLVDGKTVKVFGYSRNIVPVKFISLCCTLDTARYPNGPLELEVQATDIHNNCGISKVVPTVDNA